MADPFTGKAHSREAARLRRVKELRCARSSGGDAYSSAALRHATNIYFPKTDALTFEQANTSQIFGEGVALTSSHSSFHSRALIALFSPHQPS